MTHEPPLSTCTLPRRAHALGLAGVSQAPPLCGAGAQHLVVAASRGSAVPPGMPGRRVHAPTSVAGRQDRVLPTLIQRPQSSEGPWRQVPQRDTSSPATFTGSSLTPWARRAMSMVSMVPVVPVVPVVVAVVCSLQLVCLCLAQALLRRRRR